MTTAGPQLAPPPVPSPADLRDALRNADRPVTFDELSQSIDMAEAIMPVEKCGWPEAMRRAIVQAIGQ